MEIEKLKKKDCDTLMDGMNKDLQDTLPLGTVGDTLI